MRLKCKIGFEKTKLCRSSLEKKRNHFLNNPRDKTQTIFRGAYETPCFYCRDNVLAGTLEERQCCCEKLLNSKHQSSL